MFDSTVLLRKSSLGDVVLLGAVASSIGGHVTVVTDTRWREVVERIDGVDEVVDWPCRPEGLPEGRIIDLQGSLKSRRLTEGREVERVNKRGLRRRLRLITSRIPPRPSVADLYAEACGVNVAPLPWIDLKRRASDRLILIPGAAWPTKRWSPIHFAALGRRWPGRTLVLGGPGESDLCREIAAAIPGSEIIVEQGFNQTFKAFEDAAVVVGGDSGLLHLAGACGTPVVVLFGPTAAEDGFFVYPGKYLGLTLFCRPCSLHGRRSCPLFVQRCMNHSVDMIYEAVMEIACGG